MEDSDQNDDVHADSDIDEGPLDDLEEARLGPGVRAAVEKSVPVDGFLKPKTDDFDDNAVVLEDRSKDKEKDDGKPSR
eukprot:CAMPEP_0113957648 /NCGR_PEP_ID=MMETSP0011_2-20120614/2897_1 /TAXON_ID=101924 /ORGANISM="Rhodosorus marinus" /LENGTH=77 /DNA_ID=CAMNT_0000968255 /DNA_START=1853 /DNA_END=2086 /DNA_ORIENTATION=- /assembly_acc=CAM_ASM_000156